MKRVLVSILAVISLFSCTKSDVLDQTDYYAIKFANAFVNRPTKADDPTFVVGGTTEYKLNAFNVWGFVKDYTGTMFSGDKVEYKTIEGVTGWYYSQTQYWVPGHKYYFYALSEAETLTGSGNNNWTIAQATGDDAKTGLGTLSFTNEDGKYDMIYAEQTRDYSNVETFASVPEAVQMSFQHLLSKIRFSFTNNFNNNNTFIKVSNIQISVPADGTVDLTEQTYSWTTDFEAPKSILSCNVIGAADDVPTLLAPGSTDYSFAERFTIPASAGADKVYPITFTIQMFQGDANSNILVATYNHSTSLKNVEFLPGKAYNLHTTIDHTNVDPDDELNPITFNVTVGEWTPSGTTSNF